ncbi:DUF5677 domain-containing protein [Cellulosimicrobium sp. Marseille-Q4280]|uniref:DUF5677 domain-containing protein n=1 Tax=Cellulosimicrobium sp. Marseille-Q4280 TaxID=2937992 RepID=UPI0020424D2D|nr:DUF5677 domain-containing protein [Cellulosimicrobium sp. Marseille-Q4280]
MSMKLEGLRSRMDEVVATWDTDAGTIALRTREHHMLGIIVFGLTSHCHHLARGIRALDDAGQHQATIPLVRQLIECAITVLWIESYGVRAARAMLGEYAQNRQQTFTEYVKSGGDLDEDTLATTQQYLTQLEDELKSSGRKFRERCEDLEGGMRIYAFWRIASSQCHASTAIADLYVYEQPGTEAGVVLSPNPRPGAHEAWIGTSLTMLVLASLAADRYDPGRRRRSRLKAIARELGTLTRWGKTATGLAREAAYDRAQRQRSRSE